MILIAKSLLCKMYTYIARRRGLLFKGLLLAGTVWLTVTVLILMENREKTDAGEGPEKPRHGPWMAYEDGDSAAAAAALDSQGQPQANDETLEDDPLELSANEVSESQQANEIQVRRGVKYYGEYGKPVVLPANLSADVKKLVNEGWQKNAFNQYVSDLISLHRKLPDPRDEW